MKIAQVAPIYLKVPPHNRGGTELIVAQTTDELVRQGHDVTLFASGNSTTQAKLEYLFPESMRDNPDFEKWGSAVSREFMLAHLAFALERAADFDIVHTHMGTLPAPLSALIKTPVVNTYHYTINKRLHKFYTKNFPNCHFVSISNTLRQDLKNFAGTVYNGINLREVKFNPGPGKGLITCGRVVQDKGFHNSIAVAKKLGEELIMVGNVYQNIKRSRDYYKSEVGPHVDQKQIILKQNVAHGKLLEMMGQARAFLFPIEWEEPFGLVMIEAMSTGTPVIAFNRGAVSEVVKDGVSGFVVNNTDEMIEAIKKVSRIDRAACRKHVEDNFSIEKTTRDYVAVYEKILRSKE